MIVSELHSKSHTKQRQEMPYWHRIFFYRSLETFSKHLNHSKQEYVASLISMQMDIPQCLYQAGSVSSEVTLKFPLFSPLLYSVHQKVVFESQQLVDCVHFYLSVPRENEQRLRKCHEKVFCMIFKSDSIQLRGRRSRLLLKQIKDETKIKENFMITESCHHQWAIFVIIII